MDARERARLGIADLPRDLGRALELAEKSTLVRQVLGDHIMEWFCEAKRVGDLLDLRSQVGGRSLSQEGLTRGLDDGWPSPCGLVPFPGGNDKDAVESAASPVF
jgi:hypothetical protein